MPGILIRFDPPKAPISAVCMPFHTSIEQLTTTVTTAAKSVGLIAERVDDNRKDAQWIKRIFTTITEAKIVIGIFAHEPDKPYPNPNIMYEIGFSHALGKAILVMVPENLTLPSELTPFDCFRYDSNAVNTKSFRESVQIQLSILLKAIGEGYVQNGTSGAKFVEGPALLLCDDTVLPHYRFLLNYVSLIRERFHRLYATFIRPLSYSSRSIQSARRAEGSPISYQLVDQLEAYKSEYDFIIRPTMLCNWLESGSKTANSALTALDSFTASFSGPADLELADAVRQSYIFVHKYLQDFHQCHDRISAAGADINKIEDEISILQQTADRLLVHASKLTNDLTAFLKPQER